VVWKEEQTLLDGHNRYAICEKLGKPYATRELSLPNLDAAQAWMLAHQIGRRNLTPEQVSYLRGKQYRAQKQTVGRLESKLSKTETITPTSDKLALEHKVSRETIKRDSAFASAVDTVSAAVPDARQAILSRDTKVGKQEVRSGPSGPDHAQGQLANTPLMVSHTGSLVMSWNF
jgi:hypothetical protein